MKTYRKKSKQFRLKVVIKEKKKRKVKHYFKIEAQKNPTRTLQLCVFFKEKKKLI